MTSESAPASSHPEEIYEDPQPSIVVEVNQEGDISAKSANLSMTVPRFGKMIINVLGEYDSQEVEDLFKEVTKSSPKFRTSESILHKSDEELSLLKNAFDSDSYFERKKEEAMATNFILEFGLADNIKISAAQLKEFYNRYNGGKSISMGGWWTIYNVGDEFEVAVSFGTYRELKYVCSEGEAKEIYEVIGGFISDNELLHFNS